jgi:hypothetical protein
VTHPVFIDDDGDIQSQPKWGILNPAALKNAFAFLNNAPLQVSRVWMNEDDYKDIIEFGKELTVTCSDELKTSNHHK